MRLVNDIEFFNIILYFYGEWGPPFFCSAPGHKNVRAVPLPPGKQTRPLAAPADDRHATEAARAHSAEER